MTNSHDPLDDPFDDPFDDSALDDCALDDSAFDDSAHIHSDPVAIDCGTCDVRGLACGDCVVTVLLGAPPAWLDEEEQRAIGVLAESGLVPPLRLVASEGSSVGEQGYGAKEPDSATGDGTGAENFSPSPWRAAREARDTG